MKFFLNQINVLDIYFEVIRVLTLEMRIFNLISISCFESHSCSCGLNPT